MKHNCEEWYHYNGGYLCTKCYTKLIGNPKRTPETIKKFNERNNPKVIQFKGRSIILNDNPRKGICSWCGKKGFTNMHHIQYHDDDPLKDTVEICSSCHGKETSRLGLLRRVDGGQTQKL
jgi:hypothetical protein